MAVEKTKIKERLKALFPKANLSQTRLDAIAAKLSPKPADDADDAAIDAVLTAYNEDAAMSFEELAKYDDRMRTLEAKNKDMEGGEGTGTGGDNSTGNQQQQNNQQQNNADDAPAWAKALIQEVQTLKAEKQAQTVQQKALSDDRLKTVPKSYLKGRPLPTKEEELEGWIESTTADYKEFATEMKIAAFGNDAPPSGTGTPPSGKAATKEEVEAVGLN